MRFKSLLFIPMNKYDKKIYKRVMHTADALILDLEDAVPDELKNQARTDLSTALELYKDHPNVFVRINSDDENVQEDLELIEKLKIKNIVYPKFDLAHNLIYEQLKHWNIIPIIESPHGLHFMYDALSQISNICGVIFGAEDFSAELGIQPTEEAMLPFTQQAIMVCSMLKTYCIGYASDFTDLSIDELRKNCERSKSLGFKAAFCIHPTHLNVINKIYTVQPFSSDQFNGVSSVDGKMIGPPSIKRLMNQ